MDPTADQSRCFRGMIRHIWVPATNDHRHRWKIPQLVLVQGRDAAREGFDPRYYIQLEAVKSVEGPKKERSEFNGASPRKLL